jgi:hypothetical protein
MYRQAIAGAAEEARGWPIHWYDAKKVLASAGQALNVDSFDAHFLGMRRDLGPRWNNDHKLAMAAALVARPPLRRDGIGSSSRGICGALRKSGAAKQ